MRGEYISERRSKFGIILVYVFLAVMTTVSLFPFYIMLIMGTYVNEELFTGLKLLPGNYLLNNLHTVFENDFLVYYKNSLIVATTASIGVVFISTLTGFAFAKLEFKLNRILFLFILGTLMIPSQVGLIGFVIEMKQFGLGNSLIPLIIVPMANGFGVFWMKQYISASIHDEVLDAARVDGSSIMNTFFKIIIPLVKPAIITLFLLFFLWNWNDFLTPLVLLNDQSLYTIPLSIAMIGSLHRSDYAAQILYLALGTIPILVLFSLGSKYLIQGMTSGSVKG
ncbi:carbohydrate ABC transporter permease [Paenibacillus sp. strain BS8-2]